MEPGPPRPKPAPRRHVMDRSRQGTQRPPRVTSVCGVQQVSHDDVFPSKMKTSAPCDVGRRAGKPRAQPEKRGLHRSTTRSRGEKPPSEASIRARTVHRPVLRDLQRPSNPTSHKLFQETERGGQGMFPKSCMNWYNCNTNSQQKQHFGGVWTRNKPCKPGGLRSEHSFRPGRTPAEALVRTEGSGGRCRAQLRGCPGRRRRACAAGLGTPEHWAGPALGDEGTASPHTVSERELELAAPALLRPDSKVCCRPAAVLDSDAPTRTAFLTRVPRRSPALAPPHPRA